MAAQAAAVVALTLPGVALLHEGQADGRHVRVPVTLGRRPDEPLDAELRAWYGRLLDAHGTGGTAMRRGAWLWTSPERRDLVAVNLSDERADGLVRLPDTAPGPITMTDALSGERYDRDGATIASHGLYIALPPRGAHLLRF
jgi:hypothetical protein